MGQHAHAHVYYYTCDIIHILYSCATPTLSHKEATRQQLAVCHTCLYFSASAHMVPEICKTLPFSLIYAFGIVCEICKTQTFSLFLDLGHSL